MYLFVQMSEGPTFEIRRPRFWFGIAFKGISSVQWLSCVWLFVTQWTKARQASLSITNSQSLHKLVSIESVTPLNHLILCHPLLLLPSIIPSIRVFSNELALHIRWLKYWSFSFGISPSNDCSSIQYTTGEEWRNIFRKNEGVGPKHKWGSLVDVSGCERKVWCCKEQYCIGTWKVKSVNQGTLDLVKQETARVNTYLLEISELKWTGIGKFNSDDDYIHYSGQESFRKNGIALRVNKSKKYSTWVRSQQQNDLGSFPRQPFFFYVNNFSSLLNYFSSDNLPSPTIICMPRNKIFFIKYYKLIHFSLDSESLHSLLWAKSCHAHSRKHKDDLD